MPQYAGRFWALRFWTIRLWAGRGDRAPHAQVILGVRRERKYKFHDNPEPSLPSLFFIEMRSSIQFTSPYFVSDHLHPSSLKTHSENDVCTPAPSCRRGRHNLASKRVRNTAAVPGRGKDIEASEVDNGERERIPCDAVSIGLPLAPRMKPFTCRWGLWVSSVSASM